MNNTEEAGRRRRSTHHQSARGSMNTPTSALQQTKKKKSKSSGDVQIETSSPVENSPQRYAEPKTYPRRMSQEKGLCRLCKLIPCGGIRHDGVNGQGQPPVESLHPNKRDTRPGRGGKAEPRHLDGRKDGKGGRERPGIQHHGHGLAVVNGQGVRTGQSDQKSAFPPPPAHAMQLHCVLLHAHSQFTCHVASKSNRGQSHRR